MECYLSSLELCREQENCRVICSKSGFFFLAIHLCSLASLLTFSNRFAPSIKSTMFYSKVSYQSRIVSRVFNVKREQESVQKGLNATSGAQFATQPLVEPDHRPARAVDNVVALSLLNLPRCCENHYAS